MGDPTAKRARRLSLNPLRHIDWIGLAAMVLTGRTLMSIISTNTRASSRCGNLVFFIDRLPSCIFSFHSPAVLRNFLIA